MENMDIPDNQEYLDGLILENNQQSFDTLGIFVDILNQETEEKKEINEEQKPANNSSYAYIEKCIPKWKKIFPWVCWCPDNGVILCLYCQEILKKIFPTQINKCHVISIITSEKIHLFAKMLRSHHDNPAHVATKYLYSYNTLISFFNIFIYHYKDMKHESDVIQTVKNMFNFSNLDKKGFIATIVNIGKYLEEKLIKSLKKSRYFSIVADQCRGIIILRWLTENNKVEEHVLWSYLSVWDKTPEEYLKNFNIDFDKKILYIANTLCQQCCRCQNITIPNVFMPPRFPPIQAFASLLWGLDFLRPLSSLLTTISKLWKAYPYKFFDKFNSEDNEILNNYQCYPAKLIKLLKKFDYIKEVATEVYENRSHVEALGVTAVNINLDEKHRKILYLLQEIMDTVTEITHSYSKISEAQIVRLSSAFGSLKTYAISLNGINFITSTYDDVLPINKAANSDKVWEFVQYVDNFIIENQKSLYYNGRDKIISFNYISSSNLLRKDDNTLNEDLLATHFKVVFTICTQCSYNSWIHKEINTYNSLKSFHYYLIKENKKVINCVEILALFHNERLSNFFPEAYELFIFCSIMPFTPCNLPRSLFVSFIMEQRIESSIWARMEQDLKPWLMYIHYELQQTTEKELYNWWINAL